MTEDLSERMPLMMCAQQESQNFSLETSSDFISDHCENGTHQNWSPNANHTMQKPKQPHLIRTSEGLKDSNQLLEMKPGRKRARRRRQVQCYKCQFCPLITLKKDMMVMHCDRKGECATDAVIVRCPGCANEFCSMTSLRIHLLRDHNMVPKDVRTIIRHYPGIEVTILPNNNAEEKPSCLYEAQLTMSVNYEMDENRSSCVSGKRPSLLEEYLDISTKDDCNIQSRLPQEGEEILENTFNFTAPVSEQLPSIQPENPPAASGLDKEHLIEESNMQHLTNLQKIENDDVANLAVPIEHCGEQSTLISHEELQDSSMSLENRRVPLHLIEKSVVDQQYLSVIYQEGTYQEETLEEYAYLENNILDSENSINAQPLETAFNTKHKKKKKTEVKSLAVGYRCNISGCKIRMQSEENIEYHRRCHEGQIFNCPECCKDATHWEALSSHLWLKHNKDMELYRCDLCSYRTPSYSRLTSIHRGVHGTARPYLCDICGKGFKTVKQMRTHKVIHRQKLGPTEFFECHICRRMYRRKVSLNKHFQAVHKKVKPYLCNVCGYSTPVKHSLILHMRKHTGEKPYKCDKCDYKGADHNAFRRHQFKHSGGFRYKCQHCTYTCVQAASLKHHARSKHPGKEHSVIFSCQHCNFETIARSKYIAHATTHTNFYEENTYDIMDLRNAHQLLQEEYYGEDSIAENQAEET